MAFCLCGVMRWVPADNEICDAGAIELAGALAQLSHLWQLDLISTPVA